MALTEIKQGGLDDEAVNEAKLQVSNAGTNGQYLQKQSGNTGGLTWADAGASVGGADGVDFNDNVKARFGTGNDFEILHDGTDSYLSHGLGSGLLRINAAAGSEIRLTKSGPETLAKFIPDGAVKLYYDNSTKFETTSSGVSVTGNISTSESVLLTGDDKKIKLGVGEDLQISSDGTNGVIAGDSIHVTAANGDNIAKLHKTNSQEFYFSNSKKLEVTNTGISVTGSITPSGGIYLGGSGGSNYFDDYEEGTWTPALTYGGNSVGLDSPVGTYVKIGNTCLVRCRMQTNSNPSGNNVSVSGLPFTASNPTGDGNAITGAVYMESCDAMITQGHPVAFGFDNGSTFDIRMSGQTGSGTSSVSDNAKSGTTYMTTVYYQTS